VPKFLNENYSIHCVQVEMNKAELHNIILSQNRVDKRVGIALKSHE